MLTIDGSLGEGGGQVLRTSLSLSLVTGRPFRIERIRAGRRKPGLLAQHLTAVKASAAIGGAEVSGAALRSPRLTFVPGPVEAGRYEFAVGTAGSATLVLQTLLPPLLAAAAPSTLRIEGGTHNAWAPPFEFLERSYLPVLAAMGARVRARLERHGFFPAGGGLLLAEVQPWARHEALRLLERGPLRHRRAKVLLARLPAHIADREVEVLRRRLGWPEECFEVEEARGSRGPGNVVVIEMGDGRHTEVVAAFGARGVRAEDVAGRAAAEALGYMESGAPVGAHLADQLLLPLAVGGGGSFRTVAPSPHFRTNAEVIRGFLGVEVDCVPERGGTCLVRVEQGGRT